MRLNQLLLVTCIVLTACDRDEHSQALGTLERDRIVLKATANEIIVAQNVTEGSQVAVGTVLVQLDDRRQRAVVAIAEAELAKATAQMDELRNGARKEDIAGASARVTGARASLVEAEASFERAKQLLQQKLAAQATVDSALAARDSAEATLGSAQELLLLLTNGTRPEQLQQGEAALSAARADLAVKQHDLEELSIRSTRDAYLDSLPWNVGERVQQGATVAIMLANNSPYARVYVPEPWRARLQVGQSLPVRVDGVDHDLRGTLRWIASDPAFTPYYALNASDRARLVYLAEFDIEGGAELPTGVPAQVILADD